VYLQGVRRAAEGAAEVFVVLAPGYRYIFVPRLERTIRRANRTREGGR
jgi:hypothetical protein